MYLLKHRRGDDPERRILVFDDCKELVEYTKAEKIFKFSVIWVEKFVPAPRAQPAEKGPEVSLRSRLIPLSRAADDTVKLP